MHGAVVLKHQNPRQRGVLPATPTETGRRGTLPSAGNETTQSPARTKKTTPSWTCLSCGHHGHIPSFSADLRPTPGALQRTQSDQWPVGGISRLECASWDALFPWPAWSSKQLARRCITNITATPSHLASGSSRPMPGSLLSLRPVKQVRRRAPTSTLVLWDNTCPGELSTDVRQGERCRLCILAFWQQTIVRLPASHSPPHPEVERNKLNQVPVGPYEPTKAKASMEYIRAVGEAGHSAFADTGSVWAASPATMRPGGSGHDPPASFQVASRPFFRNARTCN